MLGASKPTLAAGVVVEKGVGERLGSAWCRAAHFSSWARSWLSSSSVRASETFSPDFFARVAFGRAFATVGTGTTRPQSGHLPATGRSTMGTLSRRPQGQRNLRKPSPVTSFGAERRSRIRAAAFGTLDPLRSIRWDFQFFTTPASYPRHENGLVVNCSPRLASLWSRKIDSFLSATNNYVLGTCSLSRPTPRKRFSTGMTLLRLPERNPSRSSVTNLKPKRRKA